MDMKNSSLVLVSLSLSSRNFDGGDLVHRMQQLTQDPDALQLVLGGQQLLAAGAGAVDVDGREHTLFSDAAVSCSSGYRCP